ncbi:Na+/melibiose symporter-like transporter [Caulobacter sp. AP07]|uniref:MFS transporter n=1 Tax=Caulobacter sp. AP07 TaxID=1144304 RepID=UPI000271FC8F|nr:MFS transporter [Caulobacter sp. AP07]EJL32348.1 Na+/melibiose symporter-like transporter [Caulobacter sp. AP07]
MTGRRSSWTLAAFAAPCLPLAALGLPLVVYLPEYYVSELGLSLSVVGAAFLLVRLADIILDPILGGMMDRTRTRIGRFRPWLAAAAPVLMIAAYALFMAKPGVGPVYLWASLVVCYIGYSMAVLAHTAWGAVLSPDYQQRSRIYGWWGAGNVVGMILVLLLPPLLAIVFKGDHAAGIRSMGWFIIILLPLTFFLAMGVVGETNVPPVKHAAGLRQYLALIKRPSVQKLLAADLLMGLAPGIAGALFFFFFERIKGFSKAEAGVLLLIYFVAALLGSPIWPALAKKVGKHKSLAIASVAYAVFQLAVVFTPNNQGLFTFNVSNVISMVILVLAGLPYSAAPLLVRSMMADIGDEERLHAGVDRTGLLYAVVNGTVKLGHALAIGVFLLLSWLGFDPKIPSAQGDAALITLYAVAPAALGLLVCAIILRYPLDAAAHAEIRRQLDERDAAEPLPSPSPEPHVSPLLAPNPAAE